MLRVKSQRCIDPECCFRYLDSRITTPQQLTDPQKPPLEYLDPLQILHVDLHAVNGADAEDDQYQSQHHAPPQTAVSIGATATAMSDAVIVVIIVKVTPLPTTGSRMAQSGGRGGDGGTVGEALEQRRFVCRF